MPDQTVSRNKAVNIAIISFAIMLFIGWAFGTISMRRAVRNHPSVGILSTGGPGFVSYHLTASGQQGAELSDLVRRSLMGSSGATWKTTHSGLDAALSVCIESPFLDANAAYPLMSWGGLTSLSIENATISDDAMPVIAQLTELHWLRLNGCDLSIAAIDSLCEMEQIAVLDLRGTRLTHHDLHRIQTSLKTCKILW